MKRFLAHFSFLIAFTQLSAQTITYANFGNSLSVVLPITVAQNSSYNSTLHQTCGMDVLWDATGLLAQAGLPMIHLKYHTSTATPFDSLFPNANYAEFDSALISSIGLTYYGIDSDSIVEWGSYEPDGKHEIFQNPDKHLIFPFSLGDSFTDNYAKTNYSDATTVSSYQTGNRTVNYCGFGTLKLPQGTFSEVALIIEHRTNSLGPDSYTYTWYEVRTGLKLLFRSENGTSITTAWYAEQPTGDISIDLKSELHAFPNPARDLITITGTDSGLKCVKIFNNSGELMLEKVADSSSVKLSVSDFSPGIYLIEIISKTGSIQVKKLMIE